LSPFEVDWLDSEVINVAFVYNTSSFVKSFVDSVDMLDTSLPDNVFSLHRCLPTNQVFRSQGSSLLIFFFLYAKVIKDSRLQLPLDEFSTGVLRAECRSHSTPSHQLGLHQGVPDVVHEVGFEHHSNFLSPSLLYSAGSEGGLVIPGEPIQEPSS